MPSNRVLEPVDEQMRPGTTWRSSDENRKPINELMRFVNYWLTSSAVVSQIPPPFGVGMTRLGQGDLAVPRYIQAARKRLKHQLNDSALPPRNPHSCHSDAKGGGICDTTAAAPGSGRALHFHTRPLLQ